MNPRLRRLVADYRKIKDEFTGHPNVEVIPDQGNPPEKYRVIYRVTGIKELDRHGNPVYQERHEAIIYLHNQYPREKPKCELITPIWHPNFGNFICIGDHWGAGETLTDIIVQIGEMIQYRTYNPKSPLNSAAAVWAKRNEHLFPVGDVDIYQAEPEIKILRDDEMGIELRPASAKEEDDDLDDLDIELG